MDSAYQTNIPAQKKKARTINMIGDSYLTDIQYYTVTDINSPTVKYMYTPKGSHNHSAKFQPIIARQVMYVIKFVN